MQHPFRQFVGYATIAIVAAACASNSSSSTSTTSTAVVVPAPPGPPRNILPKEPDAASIAANAKLPMPTLNSGDRKQVEWLLRSLAHDSMEGRGLGTRGGERAAQFIAAQMKKAGILPGGEPGQEYFQRVPMRSTATVPGGRGGVVAVANMAALDTVPADRRVYAKNVIGVIPGTDPVLKNEVVIVLSHYDHLGIRANANGGDSIYNGADDDASGTVAVMEIARHLKSSKPKRTLVFATMTGEERGVVGTNFYIRNPIVPLEKLVAGFEIEMIGRADSLAGGPGKAWLTGYERSTMGDMLKEYGIAIVPDARPSQSFFTRSDNAALARKGIVAHTLSTFNLHKDYHQLSDDANTMDFDHMTRVIASAVEAVKHLANGPKPKWHTCGNPDPTVTHPAECATLNPGRGRGGRGGQ